MYRTSTALAALVASLESHTDPIEPKARKRTHGLEALDTAETGERLSCVQYAMEQENRRLETATALQCALESQTDALTPFQADMATAVAKRIGLIMAHERHGFGMESYSGPRGRTMLRASTEGFKEWWKTFIEHIVRLWRQLVAWFKTTFNARYRKLRAYRSHIKGSTIRHLGLTSLVARGAKDHFFRTMSQAFGTEEGKYDVRGTIANTAKVFHSVTDASYLGKVHAFNQLLVEAARKLVTAEGNSWRREDKSVNAMEYPMPAGFVVHEKSRAEATWVSPSMVGGIQLSIKASQGGNVAGARGMEDTAEVLAAAKVGELIGSPKVGPMKDPSEAQAEAVLQASEEAFGEMVKLIDEVLATESKIKPFIDTCEGMAKEIEALAKQTNEAEGGSANFKIAANLLKAAQRSDKLVASMVDKCVDAVALLASWAAILYHASDEAKHPLMTAQAA